MSKKAVASLDQKPLSTKQQRAVILLANGYSAEEVGSLVKVSKGTVHNWKSQNQEYRKQLEATKQRVFQEGIQQLKSLVSGATSTLRSVMADPDTANRDKISAARTVLQFVDLTFSPRPPVEDGDNHVDYFLQRMGLE